MRFRNAVILFVFHLLALPGYGQSKDDEIKKLQSQLNEAEVKADRAEQALELANERLARLRFQAIAQALAEKSLDVEDKEQAGLLAVAALQFMKKGGGYEFDTKIYQGLYNSFNRYTPSSQTVVGSTEIERLIKEHHNIIYTSNGSDQLLAWKISDGIWKNEVLGKSLPGSITAFDIDQTGNRILVGSEANKKFMLSLYENSPIKDQAKIIFKGNGSVDQLKILSDGIGFYVLCNGGTQVLFSNWNETKEVIRPTEKLGAIELTQDGKKLFGIGKSGYLHTWNTNDYKPTDILISSYSELTSISPIRDNRIVLGDAKGALKTFSLSSNSTWRELVGHKAAIRSIAFSGSGKFMATASNDRTVRIWNMQELNRMPVIIKVDYVPITVCFSDDDQQLLINSTRDGTKFTLEAVPIDFNKISLELCKLTGRNFTQDEWEIFIGTDLPYEKVCQDNSN